MKKIMPVLVLIILLCVACKHDDKTIDKKNENEERNVLDEEDPNNLPEIEVHLDIEPNEWYYVGEDDLDYGYGKVVFFDSSMKIKKYFENAVIPNEEMGVIDITKPIIIGMLDETKRNGATIIEPNQYIYGVYDLEENDWIIPMDYDSLVQYANGCYGAFLNNIESNTTGMTIYNELGNVLAEGIDVTNSYVSLLGENLWNISYDGMQPIRIYDAEGRCINSISNSYGMVHGAYFVASNTEEGDIIYNEKGEQVITKEKVVANCKLKGVEEEHFFVVNYNDYSQMIEANVGKYQLILDKSGKMITCVNQEEFPDKMITVEYWLYCLSEYVKEDVSSNEDTSAIGDDTNVEDADAEKDIDRANDDYGIVTDKTGTIYDATRNNSVVSYYDKEGNHLLTTDGEEFQGHLQPYGIDFTPHNLFYQRENSFEVYDYECKETYQFDIGEFGIVELQSPLHDFYLITNELDEETKIYVYYKNELIAEGANLVVQVLDGNLVITDFTEYYELDDISYIYNVEGMKIYHSPCYEMIEQVGSKYILAQREGVRTIVDYDGNVVYAFDEKIQMEEVE
ncbi:hypothetical protein [Anaerosporobacter sp.]|uniref:hypothetical protein n=1 Tax=Anaerosporobacter sp. TaxID=1872529 RepID=UPI00286F88E0|nr:hypothetical protein [Anaerosporobacter sp.]